jgi:nucleoside-diphosphate-sugar epimerase
MTTKVIITGGNGYVGTALVRKLVRSGVEVHAIVHRNSDNLSLLLPADFMHEISNDLLAITTLVQQVQPSAVFHLAAIHAEPPTFNDMLSMLNSSIMLGAALLHGATLCNHPPVFVNTGTYWQFGEGQQGYSPNTCYSAVKQGMHDLLIYFRRSHRIRAVTMVLYDIFGPDDSRPKLWTKLAQADAGSRFPVTEGRQYIELVHVDDVVQALLLAANELASGVYMESVYAVRSKARLTLRELLEKIHEKAGLDLEFVWGGIEYWPGQIFDPWQGNCLPGWQPLIDPVEGVTRLVCDAAALRYAEPKGSL